jgi:hypothetical protein
MWTTIALLSALPVTPHQAELSLTHVRATHGLLGPQRQNEIVSPGDILFVAFDIEGISVDDQGMVRYSTALEVTDDSGKVLFTRDPEKSEAKMSLGGNRVPAYAHISVGLDTPPGEYGCKITIKDLATGKSTSITRKVKAADKDFALVRTSVSVDLDGEYPAIIYGCGQGIWVRSNAVGFARAADAKQPHVTFTLRVLDDRGQAIYDKPLTNTVKKDVPEKAPTIPMAFPLSLNRPGKFTVELLANDEVSGKKAKTTFPITVHSITQDR